MSNKIGEIKLDIFVIISNLAKFSLKSFRSLNHSKRYGPNVINRNTRPNKLRKLIYTEKLIIIC